MLRALKYTDAAPEKDQTLVVVSSPMSWSQTPAKSDGAAFSEDEYHKRIPLPKYLVQKQLEQTALSLSQHNARLRVHVVWAGFVYGNGEQNDIFYEFFRRAWVSLHPDLAALPVIEKGDNYLPTVHVSDLTSAIDLILTDGQSFSSTLFAVDQSNSSTQKEIMTAISEGIGSGATKEVSIAEVVEEPWCEFLQANVKLAVSPVLADGFKWKCPQGINKDTMAMLNDEFNFFRGLFPLKVFITGPPCAGKTYFAQKLVEQYGVPHITIKDIVAMGMALTNDYGQKLKEKIEELKGQAEAEYEKTRKKKDPDFDRAAYNPRLPDETLYDLVKIQLNSAGCMNKGFILDGFPRSKEDAKNVFLDKVPIEKPEGEEQEEDAEPQFEERLNERIVPQYAIALEADDASLAARAKELPPEKVENTHHNDAGMARRLKDYRGRNVDDSGETVKDFFHEVIGYQNVLVVDAMLPEDEQQVKMQEIIEQKGKPCCINMISDDDKKYLAHLAKMAAKEARAKARAEAALAAAENEASREEGDGEKVEGAAAEEQESEEEVDEVTLMIQKEEEEHAEKAKADEALKKQKTAEEAARKVKEEKEALKLEKLREQERDLLDQRSQPIRQYLMDNVVPHLTEGLIDLCKDIPDDPVDYLANFLLKKADEIDEKIIKEREEAAIAKMEAKKLKY